MFDIKQRAIIRKDIRGIVANKRYFSMLMILPVIMSVVLPSIFILSTLLTPTDSNDFKELLVMLPQEMRSGDIMKAIQDVIFNSVLPIFFLMIPIMTASVMAASSFIGEKEKRTLETLLYSPLSIREIFQAKVYASFLVSMVVTYLSFVLMLVVVELELFLIGGVTILPGISWIAVLFLVVPAITLISITLIVKGSAKSKSMEEAQQKSVFLILPLVALMIGQFTGFLLISAWMVFVVGAVLLGLSLVLLFNSMGKFTYEMLLS